VLLERVVEFGDVQIHFVAHLATVAVTVAPTTFTATTPATCSSDFICSSILGGARFNVPPVTAPGSEPVLAVAGAIE
jgi:hypothetical protein